MFETDVEKLIKKVNRLRREVRNRPPSTPVDIPGFFGPSNTYTATQLRAYNGADVSLVYVDGIGMMQYDSESNSADNGSTVVVDGSDRRYILVHLLDILNSNDFA